MFIPSIRVTCLENPVELLHEHCKLWHYSLHRCPLLRYYDFFGSHCQIQDGFLDYRSLAHNVVLHERE